MPGCCSSVHDLMEGSVTGLGIYDAGAMLSEQIIQVMRQVKTGGFSISLQLAIESFWLKCLGAVYS